MTKKLLVLAGLPRGGEDTWSSIYKFLLERHDADLAICCEKGLLKNTSLVKKADYIWDFEPFEDWSDYYKQNKLEKALNYLSKGKNTGLENSGIAVFGLKHMILKNYIDVLNRYDQIYYSRLDQLHIDYHPDLDINYCWFVEGEDYGGINDRHFIFPSNLSKKILNVCEYINSEKALSEIPDFPNCEAVWLKYLESNNIDKKIKRFKRTHFTVSKDGDFTRWRIDRYNLFLFKNLKIKYPSEFLDSSKNLISKYGLSLSFKKAPIILINYYFLILRSFISRFLPRSLKNTLKKLFNIY